MSPRTASPRPARVRLRDGSQVTVRTATPADEPALRELLGGLTPKARRMRFFTGAVDVSGAAHITSGAGAGRYGLVAYDADGTLVAHALYVRLDTTKAEVAVEVAEHLRDHGLGTLLIKRLAQVAQRNGITDFVAEVLPENRAMLDVFRDGFDAQVRFHEGIDLVEFPTSAWRAVGKRLANEPGD